MMARSLLNIHVVMLCMAAYPNLSCCAAYAAAVRPGSTSSSANITGVLEKWLEAQSKIMGPRATRVQSQSDGARFHVYPPFAYTSYSYK